MSGAIDPDPIPHEVPVPLGAYVAVALRGQTGYVSGQFPLRDGQIVWPGRVGAGLTVAQGKEAARVAALNVLGQIRKAMHGDLSRVALCRVDGFIASAPGASDLPTVLDGASEVFVELLGERGRHARGVFPVSHLPHDMAIELVVSFQVLDRAAHGSS